MHTDVTETLFNASVTGKRKADGEPDEATGHEHARNVHALSNSVPYRNLASSRLPVYGKYQLPRNAGRASGCEDGWTALLFDKAYAERPSHGPISMFGVFDGHSGDACSKHCVRSLHKHLQQQLAQRLHQADAVVDDVVHEALVQAFQETDAEIREMPLVSSSGSTATVALVTNSSIHIAWAGKGHAATSDILASFMS